jgi:hypothetical protein
VATFEYFININERDRFGCDVRDTNGKTVWEFWQDADTLESEMEGMPGEMEHETDLAHLHLHLVENGIIQKHDKIVMGN